MSSVKCMENAWRTRGASRQAGEDLDVRLAESAWRFTTSLPGYERTPLHQLDDEARKLRCARLYYKDEGRRFAVGSFKALGAAYGLCKVAERWCDASFETFADLNARGIDERLGRLTVTCATDGNYGRALAWAARLFGCKARIYINRATSPRRESWIRSYGADVERIDGTYEDALEAAASAASRSEMVVVSDTAYSGCSETPLFVMAGYSVLAREINAQLAAEQCPTHVFLQVGVGGFAASMISYLRWGARRPDHFIMVEPDAADCAYQSGRAGIQMPASGNLDTISNGLACGELSTIAWPVIRSHASAFVTLGDDEIRQAMRTLARSTIPIEAGESGSAGFAALQQTLIDPDLRKRLRITDDSRILVIGTEGATDEELYRQIVGGAQSDAPGNSATLLAEYANVE